MDRLPASRPELGARSSGYLDEDGGFLGRVPEELDGVEVQRVGTRLHDPHGQRNICTQRQSDPPGIHPEVFLRFCQRLMVSLKVQCVYIYIYCAGHRSSWAKLGRV